jgi:hypothetical protein
MDWIEGKTIHGALMTTSANQAGKLIAVPAKTPLYIERRGEFVFTGKTGDQIINARVIGRNNDPESKEPMYEAKFPVDGFNNLYVGGKTFFVPASMVEPVQKVAQEKEISGTKEEVVHFRPGKPVFTKIIAYPGDTIQFINPTAPFKVPGVTDFHLITKTTNHTSEGFGSIVAYGDEQEGFVLIRVKKNRRGGDI